MDKLIQIIQKCKSGVYLNVNTHRDDHETVEKYFEYLAGCYDNLETVESLILAKMVELDTIIELHFYPNSAEDGYQIFHYDLEMALDLALATFE